MSLRSRNGTSTKSYYKDFAYATWGVAVLYILIVVCLFNSIKVAVAVLKASAAFLGANLHTILIPAFSFAFTMAFTAAWIVVAVFLFSAGEIQPATGGTQYRHLVW